MQLRFDPTERKRYDSKILMWPASPRCQVHGFLGTASSHDDIERQATEDAAKRGTLSQREMERWSAELLHLTGLRTTVHLPEQARRESR